MKFYQNGENTMDKHRYIRTGEYREPRKGEYFLSGAIPEAYIAFNDLSVKYYILKQVKVKKETIYRIID